MKRPAPQGEKAGLHTVVKINRVCVLPMMPSMVMASSIQRPYSTVVAGINWYIPLAQPDDWFRHEVTKVLFHEFCSFYGVTHVPGYKTRYQ